MLKNYMSVIDGFSRKLKVPATGQSKNSKKLEKYETLLNAVRPYIRANEFNELKMAILRESPSELKPRFAQLIKILSEYTNISLPPDFSDRTVETRNLLTHTKASGKDVFQKEQYRDVAFCVDDLIRAYILFEIGVPKEIAKKILPSKISMPN